MKSLAVILKRLERREHVTDMLRKAYITIPIKYEPIYNIKI